MKMLPKNIMSRYFDINVSDRRLFLSYLKYEMLEYSKLGSFRHLYAYYNLFSILLYNDSSFESFVKNLNFIFGEYGDSWFAAFHKQFRQIDMFYGFADPHGGYIGGHLDSIMWEFISKDNSGILPEFLKDIWVELKLESYGQH